jgi:hypothetical protein
MELYILSKQDLSILSICKLADYQINLDEETNAKSTFTLAKTEGLSKGNFLVLNGLYRQFLFIIDDVNAVKSSNLVTVTALDISNIFDRKVIEKNIDIMKSKSIEEFLANTILENFVNSDDTVLNVGYIDIEWKTNTKTTVATNAENGLYNFHTFLTNCRQYKNIYTDFKLENLGNSQTVEGKRISVEAKNRKIVDISLQGESTQNGTPTSDNLVEIENVEGKKKNKFDYESAINVENLTYDNTYAFFEIKNIKPNTAYTISNLKLTDLTNLGYSVYAGLTIGNTYSTGPGKAFYPCIHKNVYKNGIGVVTGYSDTKANGGKLYFYIATTNTNEDLAYERFIKICSMVFDKAQIEEGTVATDYVPYNSLEFKVEGKNKFDKSKDFSSSNISKNLWTITQLENGLRVMSNYSSWTPYIRYIITDLSNFIGKTIRAKANFVSSSANKGAYRLSICNADGTNPTVKKFTDESNKEISFIVETLEEGKKFLSFELYSNFTGGTQSPTAYVDYTDIIITIDDEDMTYEPYKSQVETFPLGEGEKLYQGSFLNDNGKNHTRKQFEIDVTQIRAVTSYNNIDYASIPKPADFIGYNNYAYYEILCNKAISQKITSWDNPENINKISSQAEKTKIYLGFEKGTTLEQMKTALANTVIEYDLAEPETVPYTEEQQTAWNKIKNLTLFEGVNHISSDANMVLKYYPLEPVGLKFVLRIDIEKKQETTKLIDTTLPEVTDYNKIYEEDVTAKVQVYIREDGSEYNLYLKTDRTTTTNKDDPDRASGKIEVISVETADRAEEEALNVMKGNNYKHLVEFKIAKTSKLMDITQLHIGRPIRIKTDDDIYDSYISAITLSDEKFVYFKSGSLRITLLDKLKKTSNTVGDKLDRTGGKITGNLDVSGTLKENGKKVITDLDNINTAITSVAVPALAVQTDTTEHILKSFEIETAGRYMFLADVPLNYYRSNR